MERLRQQDAQAGVEATPLSAAQKAAIADAHRIYEAQVAECRILYNASLAAAFEPERRREVEANFQRDLRRFATDRDRRISAARNDSSAASSS